MAAVVEIPGQIRWRNLWLVALAFAALAGAVLSRERWLLNFVHVMFGVLWTGIDLFMGFVLGPAMRTLDLPARRALILRLMPRMIFIMPTLAIGTGTAGWFLAVQLNYLDMPWPAFGWVLAALGITAILTVQGLGFLLPTNVRVCLEMQKPAPDMPKIGRWMKRYFVVVAVQGSLQVAIIVVMARFVSGI